MKKAIFLDRDGVINQERVYVYQKKDFVFIDSIFDPLQTLQKDYLLIIVTNQSGIGRGYYSEQDFMQLNHWMLEQLALRGVHITDVFFDPYHAVHGQGEYHRESFSRKPNPGMLLNAKKKYTLDMQNSILVGDKRSDIEAGQRAGVGYLYLITTGHSITVPPPAGCEVIDNLSQLCNIKN